MATTSIGMSTRFEHAAQTFLTDGRATLILENLRALLYYLDE
jgi:hypothetical protein